MHIYICAAICSYDVIYSTCTYMASGYSAVAYLAGYIGHLIVIIVSHMIRSVTVFIRL